MCHAPADLFRIASQWNKWNLILGGKTGKAVRSGQADSVTGFLQANRKSQEGFKVTARTVCKNNNIHWEADRQQKRGRFEPASFG